jgi:hypothetical protein
VVSELRSSEGYEHRVEEWSLVIRVKRSYCWLLYVGFMNKARGNGWIRVDMMYLDMLTPRVQYF